MHITRPELKSLRKSWRLRELLAPKLRNRELICPENWRRSVRGWRRLVEPLLPRLR